MERYEFGKAIATVYEEVVKVMRIGTVVVIKKYRIVLADKLRKRRQEDVKKNRQDELTNWALYIYTSGCARIWRPRACENRCERAVAARRQVSNQNRHTLRAGILPVRQNTFDGE